MLRAIKLLLMLLSRSKLSVFGVALVNTGVLFTAFLIWHSETTPTESPYMGIFSYNVFPGMVAAGLVVIPVGLYLAARREGYTRLTISSIEKLVESTELPVIKRVALVIGFLTVVNLFIFSIATYESYHYMESSEFCGLVCHMVMEPEYTTHSISSHAGVECTECHIGPGASWYVKAKISGSRQLMAVGLQTYPRPIPTPVENLRPAWDTCEQCHNPHYFQGNHIKVIKHYAPDKANSIRYTILNLRIGGVEEVGRRPEGIHWHAPPWTRVSFKAIDEEWDEVVEVSVTEANGKQTTWTRIGYSDSEVQPAHERIMDCVDCHNRTAHHFPPPEEAMDGALTKGEIDSDIPWIKTEALDVLDVSYASTEEAMLGIQSLAETYRDEMPLTWLQHRQGILQAIDVLKNIWSTSVHPEMNINWRTYKSRLTHTDTHGGCFRCHNEEMVTEDGTALESGCETCHYVLSEDDPAPEVFECLHRERGVDLF